MPVSPTVRPPLVKSLPWIGNALDMAQDPAAFFVHAYRRYGPVFRIRLLGREYPVLAGPEANQFMARESVEHLRSREFWQGLVDEFGAQKALVSTDGEMHSRLRRVMRRGYARSSLSGRFDEVVAITDRVLAEDMRPGEKVGVVAAMQRLAAEQVGQLVVGVPPGEYFDDLRRFIQTLLNVRVTKQRPGVLRYGLAYRRARARVFKLGGRLIDAWDPDRVDRDRPNLIDDIMLAAREDEELFPGAELLIAVTGPYFAGLDTVANTTAALLYAVLKHPDIHAQILAEVDDFFSTGELTSAGLRNLPVLHGAVMETLRLYPIAVAAMRTARRDFDFEGHRIEQGQLLYMATTVSHFLERFYPDPHKFDIERYRKPRLEHKQPGAFAPFGLGPHTCLGAGMAEVLILLTMATMFHRRHFEMSPPDYELKLKVAPTPGPEYGFKVRLAQRLATG